MRYRARGYIACQNSGEKKRISLAVVGGGQTIIFLLRAYYLLIIESN